MLRTVARGIYTQGEHKPGIEYTRPLVLVHPFYGSEFTPGRPKKRYGSRSPAEAQHDRYLDRVESAITDHPHPVIVFDPESTLCVTAARFRALGRENKSYFISTHDHGPRPLETDWPTAIDFVRAMSRNPPLVGGGYLWPGTRRGMEEGCLGFAMREFRKAGLEFKLMPELTFS